MTFWWQFVSSLHMFSMTVNFKCPCLFETQCVLSINKQQKYAVQNRDYVYVLGVMACCQHMSWVKHSRSTHTKCHACTAQKVLKSIMYVQGWFALALNTVCSQSDAEHLLAKQRQNVNPSYWHHCIKNVTQLSEKGWEHSLECEMQATLSRAVPKQKIRVDTAWETSPSSII